MAENNQYHMWQFWVDRGGTFTDIVGRREDGQLVTRKLLSEDPTQPGDPAITAIRQIIGLAPDQAVDRRRISAIKMGTTIATNALLERKGEPLLLLVTRGFGDALEIGYQNRPSLFNLNIVKPQPLYAQIAEIDERIDATGAVVTPLDERQARHVLAQAFEDGIKSVAICLMHGYRYHRHEQIIAGIAHQVGFEQISISHDVSPLIKFTARADTSVADAYLSPLLRRYVDQLSAELGQSGHNLMFMQSNGGLVGAELFRGKDAVLSGPAGGVVGMAHTAVAAGFSQLIGFDMGGTSTDVSHFAGTFERSFETELAGIRLRTPMMNIHTVAAGGGSILSYRDGRFQVGPESAGAYPGPACYRHGGPLTVTDANLLLGRIQSDQFPSIFGSDRNSPLDIHVVRQGFTELANRLSGQGKQPEIHKEHAEPQRRPSERMTVEQIAEGFLRIAVNNMANAIKKISVERGYDIRDYTLVSFGGAGGQHACRVADALGMRTIFIHPFAGILSALGMGLADIRALREIQFMATLTDARLAEADRLFSDLEAACRNELAQQNIRAEDIVVFRRAHVRYQHAHHSLEVDVGSAVTMRAAFNRAHQARFGFVSNHGALIIEMLSCEAVGRGPDAASYRHQAAEAATPTRRTTPVFTAGEWQQVPLWNRRDLSPGRRIPGPAIIVEHTGTNVIEPGWHGEIDDAANLILRRVEALPQIHDTRTDVEPIQLELFNNLFMSVAEQMGASLANTAYSVNIKERLDFSCAVFDPDGGLVANAPHVPVHLGSMGAAVRAAMDLNKGDLQPGDTVMLNNPYRGGTHLPDVTVVTPVFADNSNEIMFVVASRGHHADIGGKTPGSNPADSTRLQDEGVVIENFKLVSAGHFNEQACRELLASGPYPCRNIDHNIADLIAQVAANATGVSEIRKMIKQFGREVVHAYMGHVQDNAAQSVAALTGRLEPSQCRYQLDSGAIIQVKIIPDRVQQRVTIDFTGTSAQQPGNYNAPAAICRAATLYVLRCLVGRDIPLNQGCLRPVSLIIPDASMINPCYPAAVVAGNTEVSQAIADSLFGALGAVAGSQGTMNNLVYGNQSFQNYETICGGAGAGPGFDGASAVHTHMTNTRLTDPEILEDRFPIRLEEFSIRANSGGRGRYRGGDGVVRRICFLEPVTLTILSSNRIKPPAGMAGGDDGSTGKNYVIRANGITEPLAGNDACTIHSGDQFVVETPGGGGYGPPGS